MYLSRTCLATGTGLEGLNKGTTSRVVRRRSGLQRVQWWRELQTLFVVAGDKKEHTSGLFSFVFPSLCCSISFFTDEDSYVAN